MNSSTISILIIVTIFVIFIGNFMGAKPNAKEMRLDNIRMMARRLSLNPKLIKTPEWLLDKNSKEQSKKPHYDYSKSDTEFVMQYSIINDDWALPKALFLVQGNQLNLLDIDNKKDTNTYLQRQANSLAENAKKLDKLTIPDELNNILPYIKGVGIQSNSISIFLNDEQWANSLGKLTNNHQNLPTSDKNQLLEQLIHNELLHLNDTLTQWANLVQK